MSGQADARALATAFNARINARDLAGLIALMSADHTFIDTADNAVRGKEACAAAWSGFFAAFPDYRNVFERMAVVGDMVVIAGRSECSNAQLNGPALWSAKLDGALIKEWRVYADTPANRAALKL